MWHWLFWRVCDVAASPSPAPKTWHPPQLPPVWEREAPAPHADASSFLSILPSEETLGETCALAKPSDGRMNPSFSSPAEASCGILQLVVAASLPAAGTLSVTPLSCGHAVYRENSEQLFVGIYPLPRRKRRVRGGTSIQDEWRSLRHARAKHRGVVICGCRQQMRCACHEARTPAQAPTADGTMTKPTIARIEALLEAD